MPAMFFPSPCRARCFGMHRMMAMCRLISAKLATALPLVVILRTPLPQTQENC